MVLDNAESVLDPRGTNVQEICKLVEELNQLNNTCICITSHVSTTLPDRVYLDVPKISMGAEHDTFYRIYVNDNRYDARQ